MAVPFMREPRKRPALHRLGPKLLALTIPILLGIPAETAAAAPAGAEKSPMYYVSPSGDDGATGLSPTAAWRTIARVNSQALRPGDQVLLKAGATFAGTIYLEPAESGTPAAPIAIGSYGRTGRATIDGGTGSALFAYNAAGIRIANLAFEGSGSSTNHSAGISFYNDLAGNVSLRFLRITNVEVSGFEDGVLIGGYNGKSGYEDIEITDSSLHGNRDSGLNIYGPPFHAAAPIYVNSAVSVSRVTAFDNLGDPDNLTKNSGNGIVFGSVKDGTIDHSSMYGNGSLCRAPEGPSGVLVYDSTDVTVEHNEAYSNHRDGPADGNGIDLDQNVSNSTVQYNYSHDNDGPGLLLYTGQNNSAHVGNTVRYNISENDSRRGAHGGIQLGGRIYGDAIYQNTVYTSPSGAGTPKPLRVLSAGSGITVRNNILFASGPLPTLTSPGPRRRHASTPRQRLLRRQRSEDSLGRPYLHEPARVADGNRRGEAPRRTHRPGGRPEACQPRRRRYHRRSGPAGASHCVQGPERLADDRRRPQPCNALRHRPRRARFLRRNALRRVGTDIGASEP